MYTVIILIPQFVVECIARFRATFLPLLRSTLYGVPHHHHTTLQGEGEPLHASQPAPNPLKLFGSVNYPISSRSMNHLSLSTTTSNSLPFQFNININNSTLPSSVHNRATIPLAISLLPCPSGPQKVVPGHPSVPLSRSELCLRD